jgi:hypothetical protein
MAARKIHVSNFRKTNQRQNSMIAMAREKTAAAVRARNPPYAYVRSCAHLGQDMLNLSSSGFDPSATSARIFAVVHNAAPPERLR